MNSSDVTGQVPWNLHRVLCDEDLCAGSLLRSVWGLTPAGQ